MSKYVYIKDAKVLKPGMKVKCCLDGKFPMMDDYDNPEWFTGTLMKIDWEVHDDGSGNTPHDEPGYVIQIKRPGNSGYWWALINDETIYCIQIMNEDWDD